MRKIIISLVALLLASTSHSQVKTTGRLDLGWTDRSSLSIPKEFTFNNVPLLTMHDESDEYLLIYDENIELIKTINIRQDKSFDYQLTFQDEEREIADRNATIHIKFGDGNATGSEIKVISAGGAQVKQSSVPAGERETQITLNGASGVYNVVQIQNNTVKATQKIILK